MKSRHFVHSLISFNNGDGTLDLPYLRPGIKEQLCISYSQVLAYATIPSPLIGDGRIRWTGWQPKVEKSVRKAQRICQPQKNKNLLPRILAK